MVGHEAEKPSGPPLIKSVPQPEQAKVRSPAALARYVQAKVRVWPAGMDCGAEALVTRVAVPAPAIAGSIMVTPSASASPSFVASISSVNCWPTVTVAGSGWTLACSAGGNSTAEPADPCALTVSPLKASMPSAVAANVAAPRIEAEARKTTVVLAPPSSAKSETAGESDRPGPEIGRAHV